MRPLKSLIIQIKLLFFFHLFALLMKALLFLAGNNISHLFALTFNEEELSNLCWNFDA